MAICMFAPWSPAVAVSSCRFACHAAVNGFVSGILAVVFMSKLQLSFTPLKLQTSQSQFAFTSVLYNVHH